jgi:hypothetical protein
MKPALPGLLAPLALLLAAPLASGQANDGRWWMDTAVVNSCWGFDFDHFDVVEAGGSFSVTAPTLVPLTGPAGAGNLLNVGHVDLCGSGLNFDSYALVGTFSGPTVLDATAPSGFSAWNGPNGGCAHACFVVSVPFRAYKEIPPSSYCTAGTSASGCTAALSAAGFPSASAGGGFVVTASGVEGEKQGLFFWGTNGRQAAPWGAGSSLQCVVPPVVRGGALAGSGTAGQCDGATTQDLAQRWAQKPLGNPGAGAVVQLQFWYRDPKNPSGTTTSLSDALEFSVLP